MEIDINLLEEKLNILSKIEEKYQENYLNYYNEFNKLNNWWTTTKGVYFLENIRNEKRLVGLYLDYFKDIKNIYKYLVIECKKVGKNILLDLNKRDEIKRYYNLYLDKINNLIEKANDIMIRDNNSKVYDSIYNNLLRLNNISKNLSEILQKFDNVSSEIDNILLNVENKIGKVDIEVIKLTDEGDYYKGTTMIKHDRRCVDADKIEKTYNVIKNLVVEESTILDDLRDSYDDVNKCYKSDSIGKIKLLEEKLINNLVKIKNNHVIETKLLLKEVVDVRKMEKEMVKSMASLGEDN